MSDLLSDIRREIGARMEELRPAVTEYKRLQEARAALGAGWKSSPSGQTRSKKTANGRGRPPVKRAVRGANQAAVVAALREHGRATVPELAEATKVKPTVLYALTRVLVDKGVLNTEKANGRRAFALAE